MRHFNIQNFYKWYALSYVYLPMWTHFTSPKWCIAHIHIHHSQRIIACVKRIKIVGISLSNYGQRKKKNMIAAMYMTKKKCIFFFIFIIYVWTLSSINKKKAYEVSSLWNKKIKMILYTFWRIKKPFHDRQYSGRQGEKKKSLKLFMCVITNLRKRF